jgi:hypothetical protein
MISVTASAISLAAAACPIARPDCRIRQVEPPALGELVDRRGSRPDERRGATIGAALHPRVVIDEAHQPGDEAGRTEHAQLDELAPVMRVQRRLDRIDGVGHDVPEEEDEDACREGRQPGAGVGAEPVHARDGQAEEDRRARDRTEQEDVCRRQGCSSSSRLPL